MIEDRKARGEVAQDVDAALAAANSFLLYYGILTAWLCGWLPDAPARDRALAESLDLHWRGLECPRSRAPLGRQIRLPIEQPRRAETLRLPLPAKSAKCPVRPIGNDGSRKQIAG